MAILNLESNIGTNAGNSINVLGSEAAFGLGGNDTINSIDAGIRLLAGGSGDDTYNISGGFNIVTETAGNDTLTALDINLETATIATVDRRHLLIDDNGTLILLTDWLTDGGTIETFNFSGQVLSNDDLIDTFASLPGFAGDISFDQLASTITIDPSLLVSFDTDTDFTGEDFEDSINNFQAIISRLEDSASGNNFAGANENDIFISQAGNAAETLNGGLGNDSLIGGDGASAIRGDDGDDLLSAGGGNDFLSGGVGDDIALGGSGNDQIFAGPGDAGDDIFIGESGNDIIGGGAGNDLLVGGGQAGLFSGAISENNVSVNGSDTIFGGSGADTLIGGGFNDINGNGQYDDGEEIIGSTSSNTIFAGTENDLVIGASGNDVLGGGTGDDSLVGGAGNDVFFGGRGDGSDTGVNDVVEGGTGNDTIFSGAGNDVVNGGADNDVLFSGSGDDTVSGGAGDDEIFGGGGNDFFTGDAGADTFSFFNGNGADTITDFDTASDILDLEGTDIDFTDLASVQAAASNATQDGVSGLLIETGIGDSVFLQGLDVDDLATINILF